MVQVLNDGIQNLIRSLNKTSIIGALGRMLESGALSDVTLSANGVSLKAHRLVLAACSQYFEQIFKDVEDNAVVVILDCEPSDLRQLLTFMYTGEVTAARKDLPSLLRLAHSLQVSGLTDANYDSTALPRENEPLKEVPNDAPINLDVSNTEDTEKLFDKDLSEITRNEKLSKLDQIVQNLYTSHKIGNMTTPMLSQPVLQSLTEPSISQMEYEKKWRGGSICTICNKRLSNQYNLRVHMETHAGRRHACRACSHVSRSRDALRKHVAYRHAHSNKTSI